MPLFNNDATLLSTAAAAASLVGVSIKTLNSQCFCISMDNDALRETLESTLGQHGLEVVIIDPPGQHSFSVVEPSISLTLINPAIALPARLKINTT